MDAKQTKSLPPDTISGLKMYQKCFCGRGSARHLARGAHGIPLAAFGGRCAVGKGWEREGWGGDR